MKNKYGITEAMSKAADRMSKNIMIAFSVQQLHSNVDSLKDEPNFDVIQAYSRKEISPLDAIYIVMERAKNET